MQKVPFGITGMNITRVGFGAWAAGGPWQFGWGPQDDEESIKAIHHAIDKGINWIDTAPAYGLGHSEEVVAKAVQGMAEKPYIFTKCSLVWDDPATGLVSNSLKADSVRKEVEDSLRRLQVETIDLMQIHWPDPDEDIEEGWQTLADLKKEGKLQHIGVSNFSVSQMERAVKIAPVETLQPPYSLIFPEVQDEILPYCKENNIGVIVYSPMASGLLSGKFSKARVESLAEGDWRKSSSRFQEPELSRNLAVADLLGEIGSRQGQGAPAAAVAWTLQNPAVTAAIVGARRPDQIDGWLNAEQIEFNDADLKSLDDLLSS